MRLLLDAAFDPLPEVSAAAMKSLRYLSWAAALALDAEKAWPLVKAQLADEDSTVRAKAALALGQFGGRRAKELIFKAIADKKLLLSWSNTAGTLGWLGAPEALPLLERALDAGGGGNHVGRAAAQALALAGGEKALPYIERALGREKAEVREGAAGTLAYLPAEKALPLAEKALNDKHWVVRRKVVASLGLIGGPEAMKLLEKAAEDKNEYVHYPLYPAMAQAVGMEALPRIRERIADQGDKNGTVRSYAVAALAEIGDDESLGALEEYMKHKRWFLRSAASSALAEAGGARRNEVIKNSINSKDARVRSGAVYCLSCLPADEALPLLAEAVADKDEWVRNAAITALGRLDDPRCGPLLGEIMCDKSGNNRRVALSAIIKLGGREARDALIGALRAEQDKNLRSGITHALRHQFAGDPVAERAVAEGKAPIEGDPEPVPEPLEIF